MKKQYMIQEKDKQKRSDFIDYMNNHFHLKNHYTKEEMISSNYPFVVDFKKKNFWICESITCCALAQQSHKIISIKEFISLLDRK